MNSVLQQLYMVPSLRIGILSAQGAADDLTEDFSGNLDAHVSLIYCFGIILPKDCGSFSTILIYCIFYNLLIYFRINRQKNASMIYLI